MNNTVYRKKKNSGGGILAGLIFLLIGALLLWFNEGRAIDTEKVIGSAQTNYIEISNSPIDSANEGKLVVVSGNMVLPENSMLSDDIFGVSVNSAKLSRTVEMYQWEENCTTDSNDYETCTYKGVWSEKLISDVGFEEGYSNPDYMPYESETFLLEGVTLGDFELKENLLTQLNTITPYVKLDYTIADSLNMTIEDNFYTSVKNNTPKVGDIRVSFTYNSSKEVSVMGVQKGTTFDYYEVDDRDYKILEIRSGIVAGNEFIEELNQENKNTTWLFRLFGTLCMIVGVACLFDFIRKLSRFIPIIGNIVNNIIGLISLFLGLALSFLIIAVAWIRFRPMLSICLLVGVVGLVVLAIVILKKKKQSNQIDSNPMNNNQNNISTMNNVMPQNPMNNNQNNISTMNNVMPQNPMNNNQNVNNQMNQTNNSQSNTFIQNNNDNNNNFGQ